MSEWDGLAWLWPKLHSGWHKRYFELRSKLGRPPTTNELFGVPDWGTAQGQSQDTGKRSQTSRTSDDGIKDDT